MLERFQASCADKPATRARFIAYLRTATRRKLANIFRTYTRRESLEYAAGGWTRTYGQGHEEPWEMGLPGRTITPERFCELKQNTLERWRIRGELAD